MTQDKFQYHRHLKTIAGKDVEYLLWKDKQYGASWKESGRSAWFMVKRMTDRLTNMMARPPEPKEFGFNMVNVDDTIHAIEKAEYLTSSGANGACLAVHAPGTPQATGAMLRHLRDCYTSEDLLAKVQAEGLEGPDGTVLAVLRDLRRYCLLVEAEITERLDSTKETQPPATVFTSGPSDWPLATSVPAEDSNRHADRVVNAAKIAPPWVVDEYWRIKNGFKDLYRLELFNRFWEPMPGKSPCWLLRPHVYASATDVPNVIFDLYKTVTNSTQSDQQIICIDQCPTRLRSRYPKLQTKCNLKEWEGLEEWCRILYWFDKQTETYRLTDVAWSKWD